MTYCADACEALFEQVRTLPTRIGLHETGRMRTKTITSGPIREVEIYSLWNTNAEANRARTALKQSRPAQVALNERNARKKLVRKINTNFGKGDLLIHPTFAQAHQPTTDEGALRIIRWFIRQIKKRWEHANGKNRDKRKQLKYVYIIERTENRDYGTRYHYHLIISGRGMQREEIESIWLKRFGGSTIDTKRYQQNDGHLTGWSKYLNLDKPKQTKATKRRWNCSKNLDDPKITVSDHKISRTKAQKILRGFKDDARAILEKAYPGYALMGSPDDVIVKSSEFVQGVYIYATMRKIGGEEDACHKGAIEQSIRAGQRNACNQSANRAG